MKRLLSTLKDCHGSVTVMTIIMMFVIVGLLAFIIDMAHVEVVKNEIQNAGDACALRGARAFLPDNIPTTGYFQVDPDPNNAKSQAQNTISDNKSDNTAFQLGDLPIADIQVGIWDYVNRKLLAWQWPPDPSYWGQYIGPGVSLPTKRTASTSLGPVSMSLATIFGINSVPVNTMATAALSGVGSLPPAYEGGFPLAVDEDVVNGPEDIIYMSPDTPDNGGWTSMSPDQASAAKFKELISNPDSRPRVDDGGTIALQNGVACTAIKEAIDYYSAEPGLEEKGKGVFEPISPIHVVFPVVNVDKFTQTANVTGFMAADIIQLRDSNAPKDIPIPPPPEDPTKYVGDCMIVIKSKKGIAGGLPGGGRWYGLLSPYPKLVK